jgi:hypothetical protein
MKCAYCSTPEGNAENPVRLRREEADEPRVPLCGDCWQDVMLGQHREERGEA